MFAVQWNCIGSKPLYRYDFFSIQLKKLVYSRVCVNCSHMFKLKRNNKLMHKIDNHNFGEIDIPDGWNSMRISTDSNENSLFFFFSIYRKFHRLIEFFLCHFSSHIYLQSLKYTYDKQFDSACKMLMKTSVRILLHFAKLFSEWNRSSRRVLSGSYHVECRMENDLRRCALHCEALQVKSFGADECLNMLWL